MESVIFGDRISFFLSTIIVLKIFGDGKLYLFFGVKYSEKRYLEMCMIFGGKIFGYVIFNCGSCSQACLVLIGAHQLPPPWLPTIKYYNVITGGGINRQSCKVLFLNNIKMFFTRIKIWVHNFTPRKMPNSWQFRFFLANLTNKKYNLE